MSTICQGFIICDTAEEARKAAAACQQWMMDHVPGYTAQVWDQPRRHAADGMFAIYVDERVFSALEPPRRERLEKPDPADEWTLVDT
jgi:hypothetical protein